MSTVCAGGLPETGGPTIGKAATAQRDDVIDELRAELDQLRAVGTALRDQLAWRIVMSGDGCETIVEAGRIVLRRSDDESTDITTEFEENGVNVHDAKVGLMASLEVDTERAYVAARSFIDRCGGISTAEPPTTRRWVSWRRWSPVARRRRSRSPSSWSASARHGPRTLQRRQTLTAIARSNGLVENHSADLQNGTPPARATTR